MFNAEINEDTIDTMRSTVQHTLCGTLTNRTRKKELSGHGKGVLKIIVKNT